jgi:hypothetical protein
MITTGLNASDLTLLSTKPVGDDGAPHATVFATSKGIAKLRKKIEDFETKDRPKTDRPYNADLVQSIGAIVEAGLRALWRSPTARFPEGDGAANWELWLEKSVADTFIAEAVNFNVGVQPDRLEFPEDVVVVVTATPADLALAIRRSVGVRALAAPTTPDFFDNLPAEEQAQWVQELQTRTIFTADADPNYITILDCGVSRAHPLISPALAVADRHAADPAWSVDDAFGHGTELAGLALYGDLHSALQTGMPMQIAHRLESAKIIPDAGENPHHLLGAMTRRGVDAAETGGNRRRAFALAVTTVTDTPHDGAPTSWSSEIDQIAAGASGLNRQQRLVLVSAGNSDQNRFGNGDYLAVCDDPDNEIESPAQAWNAICVGAYTNKSILPAGDPGTPLAPIGDLSPSSRTASWSSHWPIKPDVVFEGGNWIVDGMPPPMKHHALSMLTTDRQYPLRSFATCADTSGATALAARAVTELWGDYPALWPETVRGLFVSSARWTQQMLRHLPQNPTKGDYTRLFQRYGFGVPDMSRARRSAANALTLIVQDTITPYRRSDRVGAEHVHNEMKLFSLPWPVDALRALGAAPVTLRVSLSTFIEPNPSEPARGSKFGYASHNLRFKLKRANENEAQFLARVSEASEQTDEPAIVDDDGWDFGRNRRDVGSLHVDQITCPASDLARRNLLAVHPVTGWWKTRRSVDPDTCVARFALIMEIDAEALQTDLYAEVVTAIEALAVAETPV